MKISELKKMLDRCPEDADFLVCGGEFGFLYVSDDWQYVSVDNPDWDGAGEGDERWLKFREWEFPSPTKVDDFPRDVREDLDLGVL